MTDFLNATALCCLTVGAAMLFAHLVGVASFSEPVVPKRSLYSMVG